jgi:hypothetical protein
MDETWGWHKLVRQAKRPTVEIGTPDSIAQRLVRELELPLLVFVRSNGMVHFEYRDHLYALSPFLNDDLDQVTDDALLQLAHARNLQELVHLIESLPDIDCRWVDLIIGLPFQATKITDDSEDVWQPLVVWHKLLLPWKEYLKNGSDSIMT